MTGAEMLESHERCENLGGHPSADEFCIGMIVTHPDYQLGKVVALSGKGDNRTATIQFFGGAGQRKFRIANSPLRPVGKREG